MQKTLLIACLACLALASTAATAAPQDITVPGFATLHADVPALVAQPPGPETPRQLVYRASADRFDLSIYVNPPDCEGGGDTHEAAARCFLGKMGRAPFFSPQTASLRCKPAYCAVVYPVIVEVQGRTVKQLNLHLLFAYRGQWGNVHFSALSPSQDDAVVFNTVEQSFAYGE